MEIIKFILEALKGKKFFWVILSISVLVVIKKYIPTTYDDILKTMSNIISRIFDNIIVFVFTSITVYLFILLLKHSDKKSKEHFIKREQVYKTYESKTRQPFGISIIEDSKYLIYKQKPYRRINIINNSGFNLEYINGQVNFYSKKIRIFSIPITVQWLKNQYSHEILRQEFDIYDDKWDEFDFFITDAKFGDTLINNVGYTGEIYHILPGSFEVKSKWEKMIHWDLNWLKEQYSWHIKPRIKWHFRVQTVYEKNPTSKTTKNIAYNLTRIILTIPIITAIVSFFIYAYIKFFIMLVDIITYLVKALIGFCA